MGAEGGTSLRAATHTIYNSGRLSVIATAKNFCFSASLLYLLLLLLHPSPHLSFSSFLPVRCLVRCSYRQPSSPFIRPAPPPANLDPRRPRPTANAFDSVAGGPIRAESVVCCDVIVRTQVAARRLVGPLPALYPALTPSPLSTPHQTHRLVSS